MDLGENVVQFPAQAEPEYEGIELERAKKMFRESEEVHQVARNLSFRDRDFYDNFDDGQWSEEEKAELRRRGQPVVTSNRVKRKVNFLRGFEQRTRSDPKALPRNPQDEQAADIATDVLDFIDTKTRFDHVASQCFFNLCIEGIEAAEVIVEGDDVRIKKLDYSRFFFDPRSSEPDFSDARYLGYGEWLDLDDAIDMFPDHEEVLRNSVNTSEILDQGYEDKPYGYWGDRDRERVRIVCLYFKRGASDWHYIYFTGAGKLAEGLSAYLDEDGRPACAIIAASLYTSRENQRFGVVRDMIAPQKEVNSRRSLALDLMRNRRLWQARNGVFESEAKAKAQMAKSNGILTAQGQFGVEWGFIENGAEVSGNFELMQEAKAELDVQGPNAGLTGRDGDDQSGRAIELQQNAGLTEENLLFDIHNDWKLRIYRAMFARAKQFWREPKWLRVTDDENAYRFMMVNEPVQNEWGQMIGMRNSLARMDVDVIIEAGPDYLTLQSEQFSELAKLAANGLPIPPDIIIQASNLRNKAQILEHMQQMGQNPAQEQSQKLEMMEKAAGIDEVRAKTAKTQAETQKTMREATQPMLF